MQGSSVPPTPPDSRGCHFPNPRNSLSAVGFRKLLDLAPDKLVIDFKFRPRCRAVKEKSSSPGSFGVVRVGSLLSNNIRLVSH